MTKDVQNTLKRLERRYGKWGFTYAKLVEMYNLPSELDDEGVLAMIRFTLANEFNTEEYFSPEDLSHMFDVPIESVEEVIEQNKDMLMQNGGMITVSFTPPVDMKE